MFWIFYSYYKQEDQIQCLIQYLNKTSYLILVANKIHPVMLKVCSRRTHYLVKHIFDKITCSAVVGVLCNNDVRIMRESSFCLCEPDSEPTEYFWDDVEKLSDIYIHNHPVVHYWKSSKACDLGSRIQACRDQLNNLC